MITAKRKLPKEKRRKIGKIWRKEQMSIGFTKRDIKISLLLS